MDENIEKKKLLEKQKGVQGAINQVARTKAGRVLLRHLRDVCGFHQTSISVSTQTGAIIPENTLYDEARRTVYLELRRYISPKQLRFIEYEEENKDE